MPSSKRPAPADWIDPANIVPGKRARRQTAFYEHPDHADLLLEDIPPEELDAALYEEVSIHDPDEGVPEDAEGDEESDDGASSEDEPTEEDLAFVTSDSEGDEDDDGEFVATSSDTEDDDASSGVEETASEAGSEAASEADTVEAPENASGNEE